jgi:hypothetical protein
MQIKKHDESYIVKLEDGSSWRIWPGDIVDVAMVTDHGSPSVSDKG